MWYRCNFRTTKVRIFVVSIQKYVSENSKKQKVFFWFSVAHDKLFADALERDLKRESLNQPSTTKPVNEPALSFHMIPHLISLSTISYFNI